MREQTVTFFGHRDTPKEIEPTLRSALIDLIENKNATVFYVGNHGNFDDMVRRQLEDLSKTYPIKYYVVLAYMPGKNAEPDEHSILPEGIETVPRRFAINYRNKWMLNKSDIVVTYVTRPIGGAWEFKQMAENLRKQTINLCKQNLLS
ncbi:MAG: hypothetical protein IJE48_04395 [Clostridia bacterium]|nr:hypothetical protein [Clostridia bacterium]